MENNAEFDKKKGTNQIDDAEVAYLRRQVMLLNDRLKESEKHKSSFLSNMRNEIINPFSAVLSLSAHLLKFGETDQNQLKKSISLIFHDIFALDMHLKTIFLAAEIEAGEIYPSPASMRPEGVVAEAVGALNHLFRKKEIKLVICQSFQDNIWGDSEKIQMIFQGVLYHVLMKSKPEDGISIRVFVKGEVFHAEIYNLSSKGKKRSLFDQAQFKELCMFNQDIEGLHLSVAKSLTETLNGNMEAGAYGGEIVAFKFKIPVASDNTNKAVFDAQGLIF